MNAKITVPAASPEEARAQADQYNTLLAARVRRWARVRLTAGAILLLAGIAVWMFSRSFLYGLPLLIAAGIAVVLWLDAHETLREIDRRNWRRIIPGRSHVATDVKQPNAAKGN